MRPKRSKLDETEADFLIRLLAREGKKLGQQTKGKPSREKRVRVLAAAIQRHSGVLGL